MGDIEVDGKSLAQVAFEAYRAEVKTAFNGDPIPEWDQLDNGAPARRGWEAAARAVTGAVRTADLADRLFAEMEQSEHRSPRDGRRPLKSHAEPLSAYLPTAEELQAAPVTGLSRVSDERAARARRVDVAADDETSDDAA